MKSLAELFIIPLQDIYSTFMIRDSCQKLGVGLFALFKSKYHGLDVCYTGGSLNLLESIINLLGGSHLLFHFLTHEVVP